MPAIIQGTFRFRYAVLEYETAIWKNFNIVYHFVWVLDLVSLILREERKLSVFENMVLRRIFGPGRDEVTGEWSR